MATYLSLNINQRINQKQSAKNQKLASGDPYFNVVKRMYCERAENLRFNLHSCVRSIGYFKR